MQLNINTEPRTCETHGEYQALHVAGRWTSCPVCNQAKMRERQESDRVAQQHQRAEQLIAWADLPPRYAGARLEHCGGQVPPARAYLDKVGGGGRDHLLIVGPVGTGKTYLACAIAVAACERGIRVRYESVGRYLRRLRDTWDSRERSEAAVFESVVAPQLLILDEIGAGLKADKDAVRVHDVIAERYDRELPTVYVSNLQGDLLKDAVGDRAYDRMRDGGTKIAITGDSRRGATKGASP